MTDFDGAMGAAWIITSVQFAESTASCPAVKVRSLCVRVGVDYA